MQVLISHSLVGGDLLQRLGGVKSHIHRDAGAGRGECQAMSALIVIGGGGDELGSSGIVDAPHNHVARCIGQLEALGAPGCGIAHVELVVLVGTDDILLLIGEDKVVQTCQRHDQLFIIGEEQQRLKLS